MITFATLRTLSTGSMGAASGDYHSAGSKLRTAASDYWSHVVAPIDSRYIWHGVGRGHAETVARVERLALATASARMRTVATTLETLQMELAAAKKELQGVIDDATADDYTVDDTGRVTPGSTHKSISIPSIGGIDPAQIWGNQEAARYEARMKVAVRRAQRADKACGQLFDTVIGASFVTTTTAQPGILARAKGAYDTARGGELYASLLCKLLMAAHRQDGYATDHKEYGYPDHGIGVGKGLWDAARDVIALIALIGLAASGDADARAALRAIPASTWKQLSTPQGREDLAKQLLDWEDLSEGRPGEFVGNNLTWLLSLLGAAKGGKLVRARYGHPAAPRRVERHLAPERAHTILKWLDEHNGSPPPGVKGGKGWANEPAHGGDQRLPGFTRHGTRVAKISYQEYDIGRKVPGERRSTERILIGSNGNVYYTEDHYHTFIRIR